ncbi:heavy metal-binding domain-containing protein [bacterium]|nr:heavy metal-binding domain-containing protein [bacterium]
MLISAGESIEGYRILEYKELVFGTAKSTEGESYRQIAIKKAQQMAEFMDANAIINFSIEIYPIKDNVQEITVYGNAVYVEHKDGRPVGGSKPNRVNLEAYMPKQNNEKSLIAKVQSSNGFRFVACPKCGTKYKTDVDANGEVRIRGFEDVDDDEPGLQIFCLRCGTKFTVPDEK